MKRILIILCLLSLNACSTSPIKNYQAKNIPISRVYVNNYQKANENEFLLVIKRDKGFLGSACSSHIYLDSKHVADIRTKEKLELYLYEGSYIVGAKSGSPCAGGLREYSFKAEKGKEKYFRIGYGTNGDFFILPTAF